MVHEFVLEHVRGQREMFRKAYIECKEAYKELAEENEKFRDVLNLYADREYWLDGQEWDLPEPGWVAANDALVWEEGVA